MYYQNSYPISGTDMIYDIENHMYIMTIEYIRSELGIDLVSAVNSPYIVDKTVAVKRILKDISEQLYNFVYSYNSRYNNYQEYLMAKSPLAREFIKKAILKQVQYIYRNGKINEFVGTNVSFNSTNAFTPLEELRGARSIHPEAIQSLSRPLEADKLLYNGNYDVPTQLREYRVGY